MLFLAHFTFDEHSSGKPAHGYFTVLAKAADVETVLTRLRDTINRAQAEEHLFDGPAEVYLADLVAVRRLPEEGVLVRYQEYTGREPASVSCTFPAGRPRGCRNLRQPADEWPEANGRHVEPFITFRAKRG
jgi:hypothetical protein